MTNTPSPLVLINSTPQINGVNVAAGSTVTVALASSAGVYAWDLVCVGTDELTSPAAINGTIVINHSNNTATFTAPNYAGAAVILKSIVNNGTDINGVPLPQYSSTSGVFVLSSTFNRVGAQNETVEGDSIYGWISKLNPFIREVGSLSGAIVVGFTGTNATVYNMTTTDFIIGAQKPNQTVTVNLLAAPATNQWVIVADVAGTGATHNRIIDGNGNNINGSPTYTISTNYGVAGLVFVDSQWIVLFSR